MIILHYAGLSQGELERLYKMFEEFGVEEREEDLSDEYVSMLSLQLPLDYDIDFFTRFVDTWEDLKTLIKNIKWRRGNKRFKLVLSFNGRQEVEFVLLTSSDRVVNKALDTIEYQVDSINLQLDKIKDIERISYRFDEKIFRWRMNNPISQNLNNEVNI